jgi:ABC-type uncharacterized transport system involved in gliding motility auxiliary subunit
MIFPGALEKTGTAGTRITDLITTTAQGNTWQIESPMDLHPMMFDPYRLNARFEPGEEPVTVACKITGTFPTAFPEGLPAGETSPEQDEEEPDDPVTGKEAESFRESSNGSESVRESSMPLPESREGAAVILAADVDFITDSGAYQRSLFGFVPHNDNANFVLNALEHLGGSGDLLDIRSRGRYQRPFTVVDAIERRADAKTSEKVQRINEEKQRFQEELQKLASRASDENVGLIQSEAIEKRRELERKLREAERKLRRVQQEKIEAVERLGRRIKNINRLGVPGAVLLVGVVLAAVRYRGKRSGYSRKNHE